MDTLLGAFAYSKHNMARPRRWITRKSYDFRSLEIKIAFRHQTTEPDHLRPCSCFSASDHDALVKHKVSMTMLAFILYHPTLVAEKNAPWATFKVR